WQRKPLLVRNAIPGVRAWPGKRGLFALAQRTDVESRLVSRRGGRWSVDHGPLARTQLARPPARGWTLLVQGVNLHCAPVEQLLRRFAFLPQARLDDVMVSYSAAGGGVGAHYDGYDVFLLQGPGRRVWRLERTRRFADVPDVPLRLIADFVPQEEYLLEPGRARRRVPRLPAGARIRRRAISRSRLADHAPACAHRLPDVALRKRHDARHPLVAQGCASVPGVLSDDAQATRGLSATAPAALAGPFRCRPATQHGAPRSADPIAVLRRAVLCERRGDHFAQDATSCARATRRSP